MRISVKSIQEVEVNPKEVVQRLLDQLLRGDDIIKKDGRFYRVQEISAGSRGIENLLRISCNEYNYLSALRLVLNELTDSREIVQERVSCDRCNGTGSFTPDKADDFSMECSSCNGLGSLNKTTQPDIIRCDDEEEGLTKCITPCVICRSRHRAEVKQNRRI